MALTEAGLHQIANAFLAAFNNLSVEDHLALRAPNCLHHFAPASLGITKPKTNQDFADHINNNIRPVLDQFPVSSKEVYVNLAGRQITIWANSRPGFKREALQNSAEADWEYTGEYIFILDMSEEGKIVKILEFLDSLGTERLRILFKRARENIGQDVRKAW
jgi:hypothetical protein